MSEDFLKFIFVGVVIAIVILGNHRWGIPGSAIAFSQGESITRPSPPPLYILDPPEGAIVHLKNVAIPSQAVSDLIKTSLPVNHALAAEANPSGTLNRTGKNQLPKVGAQIALVADLETGERYAGINTAKHWPLASISKLMAAAVAIKHMDQGQVVLITNDDFPLGTFPKDLKPGASFSVQDLLMAALLESSNEAVMAIASSYGYDAFIAQMNTQADVWGMHDTHFDDPTGLSSKNISTAEDMIVMARHIYLETPQIFSTTREQSAEITKTTSGKKLSIKSINNFAGMPDFLGGKTGFTDDAQQNLLSVFSYADRPVLIVVLGSNDRFGDTEKLFSWLKSNFK